MRFNKTVAALFLSTAAIIPLTAHAQSAADSTAPRSKASEKANSTNVAEVIVTATRRKEEILNVPASLSAITNQELQARVATTLSDFIQSVPGVTFRSPSAGYNEITIRGINASETFVSSRQRSTTGYYLNDMPLSDNPQRGPDVALYDLQRVEVLRGPQGTLFGEGAPGGLVRFLTNMPDLNNYQASGQGEFYNYDHGGNSYLVNGMVNLPLIDDKLALRLVGGYRDEGGFTTVFVGPTFSTPVNNANTSKTFNFRGELRYKPNDHMTVDLTGIVSNQNYIEGNDGLDTHYTRIAGMLNTGKSNYKIFSGVITYDFPGVTVTSSTNYSLLDEFTFYAAPNSLVPPTDQTQVETDHTKTFVEEVRAVSTGTGPFRWVAGAYFTDRSLNVFLPLDTVNLYTDASTPGFTIRDTRDYDQYALYGEASYDIVPQLTLTVGGRQTWENQPYELLQHDFTGGTFFPDADLHDKLTYQIFTPKASIQYKFSKALVAYASISEGFRGPGILNFVNQGPSTYGAETVWTYEVGTKASLLDGKLYMTAAGFYNDWRNMQIPIQFGPPWASEVTNAGRARTSGGEFELRATPSHYLSFGGTLTIMDSVLERYAVVPSIQGNKLGRIPPVVGSAFVDGNFPITDAISVRARLDFLHTDSSFDNIFNSAPTLQAYNTLDGRIGLQAKTWEVYVFGRNLTNAFAYYSGNPSSGFTALAPRVIGVGATMHY